MLAIGFIGLSALMTFLIIIGYSSGLKSVGLSREKQNNKLLKLVAFFIVWFGYLIFLSKSKILLTAELPPRIPFLILGPLLILTFIFYKRNKENAIIHAIPKTWPVYYQTFRIAVELLLLYTFYEGIITKLATFEGLNFDVVMGILAPFVGYFIFRNKVKNLFLAKAWNIIGILMILFVAFIITSSIYKPQIWGSNEILTSLNFFTMPYLLVAGFLAPSAIFIHVVSLIQLRKI